VRGGEHGASSGDVGGSVERSGGGLAAVLRTEAPPDPFDQAALRARSELVGHRNRLRGRSDGVIDGSDVDGGEAGRRR
jgi:hypothetical protein